jgi:hypothetical protein
MSGSEFPQDEALELVSLYPNTSRSEEGGLTYFLIPDVALPPGCAPSSCDALLCPLQRDGYISRLFFSEQIQSPQPRNWNANGIRILERNWHAFSWQTRAGLRLAQMVQTHLSGLR